MSSRHLIGSLLMLIAVAGTCFGVDPSADATIHDMDASSEVGCTLTGSIRQGVVGQRSVLRFSITNTSNKSLILPLPANARLLIAWGMVAVSIKDSKGTHYHYVPDPGPFIPPQRNHYRDLKPKQKVILDLNLCWFRDNNYSDSPCSKPDRYMVSVTYSNEKDSYWDADLGGFVRIDGVWKGNTTCGPATVEISKSVTWNRLGVTTEYGF